MSYLITIFVVVALAIGGVFLSTYKDEVTEKTSDIFSNTGNSEEQKEVEPEQSIKEEGGVTVDLSGQALTEVSRKIFDLTNTEILDLSNNNLDGALQAEVRQMRKLRILDLSDNNFTGVPAEVGQLINLEVLNLANNPITGLPYEIGNLKNLKVLDLRGTNYARQDLEVIKKNLPASTEIKTDAE